MKRTLLSAVSLLALSGSLAFAQQQQNAPADGSQPPMHRHHAPDPNKETAHLTRQLNLTSDQSAKLEPILADRDQKLADLRANTSLSRHDMFQQMRTIHQGTMQQLSTVLTPDQLEQMKAMRHHRGEGHKPGDNQQQPAPGV